MAQVHSALIPMMAVFSTNSCDTAGMEDPDQPQPTFQLVKKVQGNVWQARRHAQHRAYGDGEEFIARKVDDFDEYCGAGKYSLGFTTNKQRQIKGLMDLLYDCNIGRNVSHIFNHENIISLAGHLRQKPFHSQEDATEDYLVWDICDAGTLELLFADRHSEREPNCYLPESLCWHVLTSVLRALVWLHDGYRQEVNWVTGEAQWVGTDMDWMPILHRGINGQTIFFQHSRGDETYGVCKLGKFGKAFVSGVPARREAQQPGERPIPNSTCFPMAPQHDHMGLPEMKQQWKEYLNTGYNSKRLYTISDDHWALGAVLFRMMVGYPLPTFDGCESETCNCVHIRRCKSIQCIGGEDHLGRGCEHPNFQGCKCVNQCDVRTDIHIDENLMRLGYSKYLKLAVRLLLDYDLMTPAAETRRLCDEIEVLYCKWRNKTEDGMEYIDVMDDLRCRFFSLNGLEEMVG